MNYQAAAIDRFTTDPDVISRLLTRYVAELRQRGVADHLWVLYALGDIVDYCHEYALDDAGCAIENVMQFIDSDIVRSSRNGSQLH